MTGLRPRGERTKAKPLINLWLAARCGKNQHDSCDGKNSLNWWCLHWEMNQIGSYFHGPLTMKEYICLAWQNVAQFVPLQMQLRWVQFPTSDCKTCYFYFWVHPSICFSPAPLLFHWTSTKHWKNYYCASSKYSQRKNPIIQYISIKSSAIKNIWLLATESESSPWWGKCLLSVFLCSFLAVLTQERERCLHYYSVDYLVTIKDLLKRGLSCSAVSLSSCLIIEGNQPGIVH